MNILSKPSIAQKNIHFHPSSSYLVFDLTCAQASGQLTIASLMTALNDYSTFSPDSVGHLYNSKVIF